MPVPYGQEALLTAQPRPESQVRGQASFHFSLFHFLSATP